MQPRKKQPPAWLLSAGLFTFAGIIVTPFLGMAAANIALGVGAAITLFYAARYANGFDFQSHRVLVIGIAGYLAIRLLATACSDDLKTSFGHLAKDWRLLAIPCAMLTASWLEQASTRWRWLIGGGLIIVLLVNIGVGLWDYSNIHWAYHWRSAGLLSTPMTLGGVAMLGIFAAGILQLGTRLYIATSLLAGALVLISATKSSLLGGLIGIGYLIVVQKKWRIIKIGILVIFAFILFLHPGTNQRLMTLFKGGLQSPSVQDRLVMWDRAVDVGQQSFLGVGPGNYGSHAIGYVEQAGKRTHAHNNYFHAYAEGGWPGLVGMAFLFLSLLLQVVRNPNILQRQCAIAAWLAFATSGFFETNIYDGEVAILFFSLMGFSAYGGTQNIS